MKAYGGLLSDWGLERAGIKDAAIESCGPGMPLERIVRSESLRKSARIPNPLTKRLSALGATASRVASCNQEKPDPEIAMLSSNISVAERANETEQGKTEESLGCGVAGDEPERCLNQQHSEKERVDAPRQSPQ